MNSHEGKNAATTNVLLPSSNYKYRLGKVIIKMSQVNLFGYEEYYRVP